MSISVPSVENFKDKAKVARKFLKERCNSELTHSQCMELLSQLFGFRDWNTAKAELSAYERMRVLASVRSKDREIPANVNGLKLGDFRRATENFPDSTTIDADFEFNLGEFINSIDELEDPENNIRQEFALTAVHHVDSEYVNLTLALVNEEVGG